MKLMTFSWYYQGDFGSLKHFQMGLFTLKTAEFFSYFTYCKNKARWMSAGPTHDCKNIIILAEIFKTMFCVAFASHVIALHFKDFLLELLNLSFSCFYVFTLCEALDCRFNWMLTVRQVHAVSFYCYLCIFIVASIIAIRCIKNWTLMI